MRILQTPGRVYPYIGCVEALVVSVIIFQGLVMREKALRQSTLSTEGNRL
jgi:hypothetical protein